MEPLTAATHVAHKSPAIINRPQEAPPRKLYAVNADSPEAVASLFPTTIGEICRYAETAAQEALAEKQAILDIPAEARDYSNTFSNYDHAVTLLESRIRTLETVAMTHTNAPVRSTAQESKKMLQVFLLREFRYSIPLYQACLKAAEGTNKFHGKIYIIDQKDDNFMKKTLKQFRRYGVALGEEFCSLAKELDEHLIKSENVFLQTIDEDDSSLWLKSEELAGASPSLLESLEHKDGNYKITLGLAGTRLLEECTLEETRKKIYTLRTHKAYPVNQHALELMIASRDMLAKTLSCTSFTTLSLEDQTHDDLTPLEDFLSDLHQPLKAKARKEFGEITAKLPLNVTLDVQDKIKPWDLAYALHALRAKRNVDQEALKAYFSLDHLLYEVFRIFAEKFDVRFKKVPCKLWDESVAMYQINTIYGIPFGHIIVDLFEREGKFSGNYCMDVLPPYVLPGGYNRPGVAAVIANIATPAVNGQPVLVTHQNVVNLFHELGHAFHQLMGVSFYPSECGYHVPTDFLELPAMVAEELAWDPETIMRLGSHHATGEKIPSALVENLVASRYATAGLEQLQQLRYARFCLDVFGAGEKKDTAKIRREWEEELNPFVAVDPNSHIEVSLRHLGDRKYRALYYTYLLNEVFAKDVYEHVKAEDIWEYYISAILSPGGSQKPMQMLWRLLDRAPSMKAYADALMK